MTTSPALTLEPRHTPAWEVSDLFSVSDGKLYRRQSTAMKRVQGMNGNQIVVMLRGERIPATAIVWCLHYGNWPKYPLVLLDDDPENLERTNIYPCRTKRFRCRIKRKASSFYHSMSNMWFRTELEARVDWMRCARDYYEKDLPQVLREEARERELKVVDAAVLLAEHRAARRAANAEREKRMLRDHPRKARNPEKPPMPGKVAGRVWHWYQNEWHSVPEACHVADDYRVRIKLCKLGAVRFAFSQEYGQVFGYREDGSMVDPAVELAVA